MIYADGQKEINSEFLHVKQFYVTSREKFREIKKYFEFEILLTWKNNPKWCGLRNNSFARSNPSNGVQ